MKFFLLLICLMLILLLDQLTNYKRRRKDISFQEFQEGESGSYKSLKAGVKILDSSLPLYPLVVNMYWPQIHKSVETTFTFMKGMRDNAEKGKLLVVIISEICHRIPSLKTQQPTRQCRSRPPRIHIFGLFPISFFSFIANLS